MRKALLVDDARFDLHAAPGHHPERPGIAFDRVAARTATDEDLARVHDPAFVEALGKLRGRTGFLDPDTYVAPGSIDAARLAAGSLVALVDRLVEPGGAADKGVALLRPPGHHARPAQAMGFCLINSVAVAAAHARARGVERVAIVDWDVHHGNGTQEMFWREPGVLYVSTHQFPFYPGTGNVDEIGEGPGKGYTVNVPLVAGGGDAVYASAFERIVLPVLEAYAPELVLVSAGFDAAARDPLAQMQVSPEAFGWMARAVAGAGGKRMVLVLEGGYDLVSLERGLESAIVGMVDGAVAREPGRAPDDDGVERAARQAKKAWAAVS
jgi:acetoin utilization deacetylase AcuC-like enzyme